MKDVILCDKLRGAENKLRSVDLRMGKPTFMMFCNLLLFDKVINIQNILKSTFNLNKIEF